MVNPELSIVIPIYNEEGNIPELYRRLTAVMDELSNNYEIIMVDDGSRDNSFQILKKIAEEDKHVKVLKLSRNYGQHPAMNAGFKHAMGNYIVRMDADMQDEPRDIKLLYEKITEGYDIVFTKIINVEKSFIKKINSMIFHFIFSKLSGSNNPMNIGAFRIFNRKVLNSLNKFKERGIIYGPLMAYIGFKSAYIEVQKNKRLKGVTHYSFFKLLRMAVNSLSTYTMLPLTFMIYSGFLIALLSFFASVFLIFKKLTYGIDVPGYTSIIIALFFLSGVILLSLGVVGDYIFRIYQEVLHRPLFLIDEKINVDDS